MHVAQESNKYVRAYDYQWTHLLTTTPLWNDVAGRGLLVLAIHTTILLWVNVRFPR